VDITTNVVSSNSGEVYSIQYYVIKFVSDLLQIANTNHNHMSSKYLFTLVYCTLIICRSKSKWWKQDVLDESLFRRHMYYNYSEQL